MILSDNFTTLLNLNQSPTTNVRHSKMPRRSFLKFLLLTVAISATCLIPSHGAGIPDSGSSEEFSAEPSLQFTTTTTAEPLLSHSTTSTTNAPDTSRTHGPCLVPESEVEYFSAQLAIAVGILKSPVAPTLEIASNDIQAEEPQAENGTNRTLRMCTTQRLEKVTSEMAELANVFWRSAGSAMGPAEVESLKAKKSKLIQRFSDLYYEDDSGTVTFKAIVDQLEHGFTVALDKLAANAASNCTAETPATLRSSTEDPLTLDVDLIESFAAAVQIKDLRSMCANYSRFVLAFNFTAEATFHTEDLGTLSYGRKRVSYPSVLMTVPDFWSAEGPYMRIANSYLAEEMVKCAKYSKILIIVDNTDEDSDDLAEALAKAILKLMEIVPGYAKFEGSLALLVTGANGIIKKDSASLARAVSDSVVQSRTKVFSRLPEALTRMDDIYALYDSILSTDAKNEYVNIAAVEEEGDASVLKNPEISQFIKSTSTKSKYNFRKSNATFFNVRVPALVPEAIRDIESQLDKKIISLLEAMNVDAISGLENVCYNVSKSRGSYVHRGLRSATIGKVTFNPYIWDAYSLLRQMYGNFDTDAVTKVQSFYDYLTYVTSSPGTSRVQTELTTKAVGLLKKLVAKIKSNAATSLRTSVKEVLTVITDVIKSYETEASSVSDVNAAYQLIKETKDIMSSALDSSSSSSSDSTSTQSKISQVLSFWNVSKTIQDDLECSTQRHQFLNELPSGNETDEGIITSTMVSDVQTFTATVYNVQAKVLRNLLSLAAGKLQDGADVETIVDQLDRETLLMAIGKLNTFTSSTLLKRLVPFLPGNGVPDLMVHRRFYELTANATSLGDSETLEFDAALQVSHEKAGIEARGQLKTISEAIRPSRDAIISQVVSNITGFLALGSAPSPISTFQFHGPQVIRELYDGHIRTGVPLILDFIDSLPGLQDRILAYDTFLDELVHLEQLDTVEFVTFATHIKVTRDLYRNVTSASVESRSSLESLIQKIPRTVRHLVFSGSDSNSSCVLTNAIYNREMYSESVYVHLDGRSSYQPTSKYYWRFQTSNGGKTFQIRNGHSYLLADSYHSKQYHSGQYTSRGVLIKDTVDPASRNASEWKIIPTDGGKYLRFNSVKFPEDVLYAEGSTKSANQARGWRILASKQESSNIISSESMWNIVCSGV